MYDTLKCNLTTGKLTTKRSWNSPGSQQFLDTGTPHQSGMFKHGGVEQFFRGTPTYPSYPFSTVISVWWVPETGLWLGWRDYQHWKHFTVYELDEFSCGPQTSSSIHLLHAVVNYSYSGDDIHCGGFESHNLIYILFWLPIQFTTLSSQGIVNFTNTSFEPNKTYVQNFIFHGQYKQAWNPQNLMTKSPFTFKWYLFILHPGSHVS